MNDTPAQSGARNGRVLSIAKIFPTGPRAQLVLTFHGLRSLRQASRQPGFVEAVAPAPSGGAGFVVTLWESEDALRSYVHSGAHGGAAKKVRKLARAHVSCHVPWDGDTIPDWREWGAILARNPRIIDTRHGGNLTEEQKLAGLKRWHRFPPPFRARGRAQAKASA